MDNIMTTTKDIIGSGGGGKSGGGGGLSEATDTLRTNELVSVLHLLGEGVVNLYTGDGQSIYLNNIPLQNSDLSWNFGKTSYEFKSGSATQSPLSTTVFPGASNVYTVNQIAYGGTTTPLVAPAPVIYDVVSGTTDYCKIGIRFPNGLASTTSQGSIVGDSVTFALDTKPHTSSTWVQQIYTTINDKSSQPAVVQYRLNNPSGVGSGVLWDIRLRRITQDNETSVRKNAIEVGTVEEVEQIQLPYNGVSYVGLNLNAAEMGGQSAAIPGVSFMLKGQTIQVPSNYNATTRVYTGTWDGTFTTAVSDNPAWILYDLLTNSNYGCGLFGITAAMVDKYSFYNAAVFNDVFVNNGVGGTEPRFTFNAPIQNRQDMLKTLQEIAGAFNAVLGTSDGLITCFQDRPTNSLYPITKSNVIGDSNTPYFSYHSSALPTRTTVCNTTYVNGLDNRYLPKVSSVSDAAGLARYGYQPYDMAAFGATTEGQAQRAGKWWLYTNLHQTETVTFKMGLQGLLVNLYDVFDLYDEDYTLQAGAGRVVSSTTNTITFDQPIVVSGTSPTVSVLLSDGITYETHPITTAAGTWSNVSISGTWSVLPTQYDNYIVTSAVAPRTFRIINIKIDTATKEATIVAQLYDKNNYTNIESGIVIPANTYTIPTTNIIADVSNIAFTPTSYISTIDNSFERGVTVSWDAPANTLTSGYVMKWRWNAGNYVTMPETSTTLIELKNILPGTYDVIIYALNIANSTSLGKTASYILDTSGGNVSAILSEVSNLSVSGGGVTWTTPDCSFVFDNPVANGANLAGFEVTIMDSANVVLQTDTLGPVGPGIQDGYIYTYAMNSTSTITNAPFRTLNVKVQGIDINNNTTLGVFNTFTNPAPATPAYLTITGGFNVNQINYNKPIDPDYVGTLVWQSNISGFTPDAATIRYTGPDTAYTDVGLSTTTTYYYRVASYDTFYNPVTDTYLGTGLNISPEVSSMTALPSNTNEYQLTGTTWTPNSPATNSIAWSAGIVAKTQGSGIGTTWNISAGNAAWTSGIMYIYYAEGDTFLTATTNITTAIAANKIILATYRGGTSLQIGNGNAYMDGSFLIAGTVGASQLVTGSAVITGSAQIANGIIGTAQIQNAAITNAQIATAAISTAQIQNAAITNAQIATTSISTAQIQNGAITNAQIGIAAISTAQIQNAAISTAQIQNAAVDTLQLAGQAVTLPASSFNGGVVHLTVANQVLASVTITTSGYPVELWGGCNWNISTYASGVANLNITQDGVVITYASFSYSTTNYANSSLSCPPARVQPAAGTHTYQLTFTGTYYDDGGYYVTETASQCGLVVMEVKR